MKRKEFLGLGLLGLTGCNEDMSFFQSLLTAGFQEPIGASIYLDQISTSYFYSEAASLLNDQIKGTTQKFSFSIWMKKNNIDLDAYETLFSRDNNTGGRQFALEFRAASVPEGLVGIGGQWSYYIFDSPTKYSFWETTYALNSNKFYNLIVTFDNTQALGSKTKIYINAFNTLLNRTDVGGGVSNVKDNSTEPIYLGVTNFGTLINPFQGHFSNMVFYTDVLTQSDVNLIYNNGNGANESTLATSIAPFMAWNIDTAVYTDKWTVDDSMGTTYGVSKKFLSVNVGSGNKSLTVIPSETITYQSETTALLAQMVSQPDIRLKNIIDDFYLRTKADGDLAELDEAWCTCLHTQQASRLRMKNPTGSELTEVGTPTWTQYQGFTGAVGKYLNFNFSLATNGVKYTQNSSSIGAFLLNNINEAAASIGVGSAGTIAFVFPRNANAIFVRINSNTNTSAGNTVGSGIVSGNRTASNNQNMYANAAYMGTSVVNSVSVPTGNVFGLCYNNAGTPASPSTNVGMFFYIGGGAVNNLDFDKRVRTLCRSSL